MEGDFEELALEVEEKAPEPITVAIPVRRAVSKKLNR
jgi:hypothetical protein